MSPPDIGLLLDDMAERDLAILHTLQAHRLASTGQLKRLHFYEGFVSEVAATRAAIRVLNRLERDGLIARLQRRVGGARRGSASLVWQLGAAGDRLLRLKTGDKRKRYLEPVGGMFVRHTLAVTELAVELVEAVRASQLDHAEITGEPKCWRSFLGPAGSKEILKPDLHAVTTSGDYEDHWFFERDLTNEHPPVVARMAKVYERYMRTGRYQADHRVFPAVLWIVDDEARQIALERALRRTKGLTPGIHRVITKDAFIPTVLAGSEPVAPNN